MPIHPKAQVIPFNLHGKGEGVLHTLAIEGSPHTIRVEGHPAFGGKDSAPSPLDYALGSLVACTQITSIIVARDMQVELGAFDITLKAALDNSVLVYGAEGNSNFSSVELVATVESDMDEATFETFASEVERRCPLTQLYKRSGVATEVVWHKRALKASAA